VPELINRQWHIDNPELANLLSEADRKLGELNAFSQLIPNIDFFIRMHITKEATTSSRIEGTQTNMEEAFVKKENLDPEKRKDWDEVHNYIQAVRYSIDRLKELPVSTRLIKETHALLLQGVRGEHKLPGSYRSSQNWIGATLKDAVFVPPHHTELGDLLSDMEQFLHNDNVPVPPLIKIGIIHYQFETIHPFLDGNGRMGRLLITLFLVSTGLLHQPALYVSDFFERNRSHYYDYLHRVRTHNDMLQWLKFFLSGILETSEKSIQTFKDIIQLKDSIEQQLPIYFNIRRIENVKRILTVLYQNPVTSAAQLQEELQLDKSTAARLINDFIKLGWLKELTGFKRNRLFVFEEYMNIFNK
jgi:Fic family protein